MAKWKDLRDYVLEKMTTKLNKPVSDHHDQTIGELILENSLLGE